MLYTGYSNREFRGFLVNTNRFSQGDFHHQEASTTIKNQAQAQAEAEAQAEAAAKEENSLPSPPAKPQPQPQDEETSLNHPVSWSDPWSLNTTTSQ